jgi:N-acetylmuramoyl-L-alanine amidase
MTREEIEKKCWDFFRSNGFPEVSVGAIMGNIEAESEFDPNLIEKGSGIGLGLFQWSYERRTKLENYGTDVDHQLQFALAEITGNVGNTGASKEWINKSGYKTLDDFMSGNGSLEELTKAFCYCFERPGIPHIERRIQSANTYYNKFTGSAVPTVSNATNGTNGTTGTSTTQKYEMLELEATNYQIIPGSEKYGDVLFGRRCRVVISDVDGNGLDVSNLRIVFDCSKCMSTEPNMSIIKIYNLNAETENKIIMSAARVLIEAGYEGSCYGTIFDGDIIQVIRYKDNSTDYVCEIIAIDCDRAVNFSFINFSMIKGQTARKQLEAINKNSDTTVDLGSISDKLGENALTRGKVFFGNESDYMKQIAKSIEGHAYYDNGAINIIKLDELPQDEIVELNPKSGLIGVPEQTDFGVSAKSLINPYIKLNSLVHIDNSYIKEKRISVSSSNLIPGTTDNNSNSSSNVSGARNIIISEAKKLCDDPNVRYSQKYRNQTVGGITYYDCSSFVKHCYKVAGFDVVDVTTNQYADIEKNGKFVSQDEALPGDIVLWGKGSGCYHVAIYAGDGYCYAAIGSSKPADEQVEYHKLYGEPSFGRFSCMLNDTSSSIPTVADAQNSSNNSSSTTSNGIKVAARRGHQRTGADGCADGIVNEIEAVEKYFQAVIDGLNSQGYRVKDVTPPESNRSLNDSLSYGINEAKKWGAEYFISCHANAGGGNGCEVLYSSSSSKGKSLAESIVKEISSLGFTNRGAVVSDRSLYEINHGNSDGMTAVIIEPFFIDTQSDVDKFNSVGGTALGNAIVKGITGQAVTSTGNTANQSNTSSNVDTTQGSIYDNTLYRALDKDGIYRVYKVQYTGDTRGDDFYLTFQACSQIGGNVPIIKE